ncbi:MAG: hypothetical protein Q9160_003589 [Pyrenula sp. 1 TL-2023]
MAMADPPSTPTPKPLEVIYKSYITALNSHQWDALPTFLHSDFSHNGKPSTPASLAQDLQSAGPTTLEIDALTVDEKAQKLAATLIVKWRPSGKVMEFEPPKGKEVVFVEQCLNEYREGKLVSTVGIRDWGGVRRQLEDPEGQGGFELDRVSAAAAESRDDTRPATAASGGLEEIYRAYLSHINTRTLHTAWSQFVHPHVIYDGTTYTLSEYQQRMQAVLAAVPDLFVEIHTIVVDEGAQRVAVRLESLGTPTRALAGIEATGREKRFAEHLTYRFSGGKIERVWSLADWGRYGDLMGE